MNNNVPVSFTNTATESTRGNLWARLEQVYSGENNEATLGDLSQMMELGRIGTSAFGYVTSTCPYAVVEGDIITVSLDLYVWPSSMSLTHELSADVGTFTDTEVIEKEMSFDVPFKDTDSSNLEYVFEGDFEPEMPYLDSDGSDVSPAPEHSVINSTVRLSESATTVLRAQGMVRGYKHTLVMELTKADPEDEWAGGIKYIITSWDDLGNRYDYDTHPFKYAAGDEVAATWKLVLYDDDTFDLLDSNSLLVAQGNRSEDLVTKYFDVPSAGWNEGVWVDGNYIEFTVGDSGKTYNTGYKIENLRNTVMLSWTDENGEVQTDALTLEIPPCVEELLAECPESDNIIKSQCAGQKCKDSDRPVYNYYYSTCDGKKVKGEWVHPDE